MTVVALGSFSARGETSVMGEEGEHGGGGEERGLVVMWWWREGGSSTSWTSLSSLGSTFTCGIREKRVLAWLLSSSGGDQRGSVCCTVIFQVPVETGREVRY